MTVNYRNEPGAGRRGDPQLKQQAAGLAGDLSYVFRSRVVRKDPVAQSRAEPVAIVKPLSEVC
jgi:hypothetical protein